MEREIGEGASYGLILTIHLVALILFVLLFIPLSYYYQTYNLFIIGSIVAGVSPLFLLFGSTYVTCALFGIGVAIAEAIIAPRLIDYTIFIAPNGKLAFYMAMVSFQVYLAQTISGLMSGLLLEEFCPEDGERHCEYMWLIIGLVSLIAPATLILFRKWIEQPFIDLKPYITEEKDNNNK